MLVYAQGENLDFIFQSCTKKKLAKNTGICFEINRTRMEAIYVKTVSSLQKSTYRCETSFQKRRRFQIGFMVTCRNFSIIYLRQQMGISVLVVDCPLGVANHRLDFEFSWVELILVLQCLIRNRCLLY